MVDVVKGKKKKKKTNAGKILYFMSVNIISTSRENNFRPLPVRSLPRVFHFVFSFFVLVK